MWAVNNSKIAIRSGFNCESGVGAEGYLSISNQYSILKFAQKYSLSWIIIFKHFGSPRCLNHYLIIMVRKLFHNLVFRIEEHYLDFGHHKIYFFRFAPEWEDLRQAFFILPHDNFKPHWWRYEFDKLFQLFLFLFWWVGHC